MNERWREFLESQGLTTGGDGHTRLEDEAVDRFQKLSGDSICDLSPSLLVAARGADSGEFLQNQLSNDISALDPAHTGIAGYCNPKGRLIALFRVWRHADGFMLQLPRDLEAAALERLRKYVLRARVEFASDPEQVAFGICGKTVAKALENHLGVLPGKVNALQRSDALTVMRIPGDRRPRFQVVGPVDACIGAWQKLVRHAAVLGSWTWARLDILAGIPDISAATSESFIPQMVNLDLLGAVNFRKGCYPGQEIVARMHYLGKLKQRMGRFRADASAQPQPGDRVYAPDGSAPGGTVVSAQPGAGAGWDLLAVVRVQHFDQQGLYLNGENGVKLFWQELPYTIRETSASGA